MQALNKNGIPLWVPKHKRKRERKPLNIQLPLRRFALIDDEAEVEIVVPHFSPIVDVLTKEGWREVFEKEVTHPDGLGRLYSGSAY